MSNCGGFLRRGFVRMVAFWGVFGLFNLILI